MLKRLFFLIVIGSVLAVLLRLFIIEAIYVASGSMEPTLLVDSQLFLEKVSLYFKDLKRGDIVVFPSPVEEEKELIKRVIAIPGDEVAIREKIVYLNGLKLSEDYVQYTRPYERLKGDTLGPVVVPEGMVFVMGDNRDESRDSRDWIDPVTGERIFFIAVSEIKGKIIGVY